ncbi:MAG: PQQ-like beta-propeller repeat protein, partial [Bacteroidetes bacterium]|nr:PQQ-like beta-propeller repeat protein [Bacteroidota bacterium]
MLTCLSFLLIISFSFFTDTPQKTNIDTSRQWSSYRGYYANGVLNQANLPDTWNAENGENIKWKVKIPGLGLSSPVIWGDKLFITSAVSSKDESGFQTGIYGSIGSVEDESEHEWKVFCYNKKTGTLLWEQTACTGIPKQKRHPKSSHANCSAATNGEYIVVFFGSEGLYCYDMEGELQWKKDFGVLRSVFFAVEDAEWEFSSSPLIHEGKVIIQADVMENSFLATYDAKTGEEIWRQARDEYPGWCTPNIYKDGDKTRIAVNGFKHRGGYDFETGEEIWRMSGGGDIPVPTPIVAHDMIYFNSAHGRQSPILAIKKESKGD